MVICIVIVFVLVGYFGFIKPQMDKNKKEDEKDKNKF